eukprot:701507-Alexandrium_andersonii.AAC.1
MPAQSASRKSSASAKATSAASLAEPPQQVRGGRNWARAARTQGKAVRWAAHASNSGNGAEPSQCQ